jgi:RNA recognition motif-containing protein
LTFFYRSYFQKFGNIVECNIMKDKEGIVKYSDLISKNLDIFLDKLRGFAFLTFDDYDGADRCILEKPHYINEKELDVRKAIPREQISRTVPHNNMNPEVYYQSQLMMNHPTLSPTPYAYFHPSSQLNGVCPTTLFYPGELPNNKYFPSSSMRISNNSHRKKITDGQTSRTR